MKILSTAAVLLAGISLSVVQALAAPSSDSPTPLVRAHAHNDYEHTRPLLDALEQGFGSVEADIYLIDGKLLVAHNRDQVRPERTLQALYLDPLRERVRKNGGRVYRGGPPILLLIDVKTEAEPTYRALREALKEYRDILTRFAANRTETSAVTAIISGNRARQLMAEEPVRDAALDGRPEDLDGAAPRDLIPLVSEDWKRLFQWRGVGPFPEKERNDAIACATRPRAGAHDSLLGGCGSTARLENPLHSRRRSTQCG